jgi:hypothetical protein
MVELKLDGLLSFYQLNKNDIIINIYQIDDNDKIDDKLDSSQNLNEIKDISKFINNLYFDENNVFIIEGNPKSYTLNDDSNSYLSDIVLNFRYKFEYNNNIINLIDIRRNKYIKILIKDKLVEYLETIEPHHKAFKIYDVCANKKYYFELKAYFEYINELINHTATKININTDLWEEKVKNIQLQLKHTFERYSIIFNKLFYINYSLNEKENQINQIKQLYDQIELYLTNLQEICLYFLTYETITKELKNNNKQFNICLSNKENILNLIELLKAIDFTVLYESNNDILDTSAKYYKKITKELYYVFNSEIYDDNNILNFEELEKMFNLYF